jgi:hypothetical protein
MIFQKRGIPRAPADIRLDGLYIKQVTYTKHLGVGIGEEQSILQDMIQKGRTAFYALLCLGSSIGGVNPATATKIYWSTVIPSMMYGMEVSCLSEDAMDLLELEHRNFGRRIQGLPRKASNPASYALLGWKSLRAYRDIVVLSFFYRILTMKATNIFKKLVVRRLIDVSMNSFDKLGPTAVFAQTCLKYGLFQHVQDAIESGVTMQLSQWKTLCKSAVLHREESVHQIELLMYERLKYMRNIPISVHPWWAVSKMFPRSLKACSLMIKLLTGEEPLCYNTGRYEYPRAIKNQQCKVCKSGDLETVEHFLYICQSLATSRQTFVTTMNENVLGGSDIVKTKNVEVIVNANVSRGGSKQENIHMLNLIAQSVYSMLLHRRSLLEKK